MFLQALQFQQQQAALGQAQNIGSQFGYAPGGNWLTWGAGGPTQPAAGTPTLQAGGMTGAIGYIPGYTGVDASQTLAQQQSAAGIAQNAANLTGWYAAPAQSQWTPGSFVRLDPNTYDTKQYGDLQMSYVLPSGQLQRVTSDQARAMGWNGNVAQMNTLPATQAIMLERAPPQQLPQQTLAGLTGYANLNAQAMNQALQQAGATGMYTAPAPIYAPGTNIKGEKFSDLPADTQQAYYMSNGSDWNAAMAKWVGDANRAINQAAQANNQPLPGGAGTPQETLQAQQQYFNQAQQMAQTFGRYYAPGAPGQAGGAPAPGTITEQAREYNMQNALQQGQLGQQYLSTAAQLQGPQNTFQLSNYLRGAQGNPNVPVYLQNLANNIGQTPFQATGTTAPTPQSAAGLVGQMGGQTSATPGWDYNQTLGAIQNIMSGGAQKLGPGALENLSPDELQALGSGIGAAGGSMPSFLQQYQQSRVGQQAPIARTSLV